MYKITITKMVENPNYQTEKEVWDKWAKDDNRNYFQKAEPKRPEKYIEEKSLDTTVTEEEFKAIKKAAVEIM